MRPQSHIAWLLVFVGLAAAGCNRNPFLQNQQGMAWQPQAAEQPYVAQLQDLNRRVSQLDADNRDLHAQLAQSRQQVQLSGDRESLLRKQLGDTAAQLRDALAEKQETSKQLVALQQSTQFRGGATLTANSSLKNSLQVVNVPGVDVRLEDDVVRIELPADRLFVEGTAQLQPNASTLLDQVADAISRHYPRQIVGIEGHTDTSPLVGAQSSSHQLSVSQSLVVFDQLTRRNRLPSNQLFTVGHGPNHPRVSNATPSGRAKNRRVELVVYPETVQ
jgi:flagellar motor protein MotB